MILEISVIILLVLFLTSCYVIWNLNTKQEMLETWVEDFIQTIEKIQKDLKSIDYRGSFEADDETGVIFDQMKTLIQQLDRFKGEEDATQS